MPSKMAATENGNLKNDNTALQNVSKLMMACAGEPKLWNIIVRLM